MLCRCVRKSRLPGKSRGHLHHQCPAQTNPTRAYKTIAAVDSLSFSFCRIDETGNSAMAWECVTARRQAPAGYNAEPGTHGNPAGKCAMYGSTHTATGTGLRNPHSPCSASVSWRDFCSVTPGRRIRLCQCRTIVRNVSDGKSDRGLRCRRLTDFCRWQRSAGRSINHIRSRNRDVHPSGQNMGVLGKTVLCRVITTAPDWPAIAGWNDVSAGIDFDSHTPGTGIHGML